MHSLYCVVIHSALRLLPDQPHFAEHPEAVAHHVYFASFIMVPTYRYLFQLQAGAISQIEQLNIETEAVDCCRFHQWPADAHAKSLEATLSVPEREARGQTHGQVKNASSLLTPPRLMNANQVSVESSRTESQITFTTQDWIYELRHFGYRCR